MPDADAKFCSSCGAGVSKATPPLNCPSCNKLIDANAKFCADCGTKVGNA